MLLNLSHKVSINLDHVIRWSYNLEKICPELTDQDVYHISVQLHLTGDKTILFDGLQELSQFCKWVVGQQDHVSYKEGTLQYYADIKYRFEHLKAC